MSGWTRSRHASCSTPTTPASTRSRSASPSIWPSASGGPSGASGWSADEDRATAVAETLEAGTVWVNQHPMLSTSTPFGGLKQSGIGVESSRHGLAAYTDISVLRVKRGH